MLTTTMMTTMMSMTMMMTELWMIYDSLSVQPFTSFQDSLFYIFSVQELYRQQIKNFFFLCRDYRQQMRKLLKCYYPSINYCLLSGKFSYLYQFSLFWGLQSILLLCLSLSLSCVPSKQQKITASVVKMEIS